MGNTVKKSERQERDYINKKGVIQNIKTCIQVKTYIMTEPLKRPKS